MGKVEKYGNYIRAIGYLSIRAKIVMPSNRKNLKGALTSFPGSSEWFVYHTNTQMAGPYKSHKDAETEAYNMIDKHFTKKDLKK